jgi:hypothetical protein
LLYYTIIRGFLKHAVSKGAAWNSADSGKNAACFFQLDFSIISRLHRRHSRQKGETKAPLAILPRMFPKVFRMRREALRCCAGNPAGIFAPLKNESSFGVIARVISPERSAVRRQATRRIPFMTGY